LRWTLSIEIHEQRLRPRTASGDSFHQRRDTLNKEGTLAFRGRDVLYVVGDAMADSACCGVYGCRFAYIPGYVVDWKYRTNDDGLPVSSVEPVGHRRIREMLTVVLQDKLGVTQVQFG